MLIPAPWETRSIGLQSFLVNKGCYKDFSVDALRTAIKEALFDGIFVSARVEKDDYQVIPYIQKAQFYFVEQTLDPQTSLQSNEALKAFVINKSEYVPHRYKLKNPIIKTLNKTDKDACTAVEACAKESFSDDRFHTDPNCPKDVADIRFFNWARDLIDDSGVTIYIMSIEDEIAGFLARKENHMILAGFSRRYIGAGLGQYLWLGAMEAMLADGVNLIDTRISANNVAVMNLYVRLGYKFKNPAAVFHYWQWPDEH
jgi:ribosomal protein S18 acetylase RimI-like enzyme